MDPVQTRYSKYGGVACAKSMESKLTKNFSCSNCSQIFTVRDPLHPRGLRCPLLLHCGHSACENCIRTSLRNEEKVVCRKCKHTSVPSQPNKDVRLEFPLNVCLLGVFASRFWSQEPEDSKIAFIPAGSSQKSAVSKGMQQQNKVVEICSECMERQAEWKCLQCEVPYCGQCFTTVHKAARALSKHQKCPLGEKSANSLLTQPNCEEHPQQKVEFFCKECNIFVCSHCVICLHQGHGVITKKKKNEEGLKELDEAKEKATEVLKRLLHTQKKLAEVQMVPVAGSNLTPVEFEVTRHFMYLHGVLQLLEQSIIEKLNKAKSENSRTLTVIVNEVNENILQVRHLIQDAVAAKDPTNIDKVELSAVTKKLSEVQELRCHLVAEDRSDVNAAVKFVVDESFLSLVDNHCYLDIPSDTSYSLVKTDELPPDIILEPIDDDIENDAAVSISSHSRSSSVSALAESMTPAVGEKVASNVNEKNVQRNAKYSRNTVKGSSEIVNVCHLRHPSSFYVHRVADATTLNHLSNQLAKHADSFTTPPSSVHKDGLYMVQYQVDRKWYRARVRALLPPTEVRKEEHADILYIDYGNSEILPITRLRCIPARFALTPAIALHCSLFGIAPVSNDKWTQECVKAFAVMVDGSRVRMVVMDFVSDTYQVDLCQLPGDPTESDVPISVRDALVFLEHAIFPDESRLPVPPIQQGVPPSQQGMKYLYDANFQKGTVVDVVISHIETPHSFFVQRLGEHARYLTALMKDMNTEYSNAGRRGIIYTPQIGMPCAAQYTIDKKWYRAKVIHLPGNKLVEVLYVDYGNQEVMSWDRLRKVHERFLRIPAQAVHCSLSDLVPSHQGWTPAVKDFMIKATGKKVLRLYVDEVQRLQLKVTLYESQEDIDMCINALLAREGYATSVGVSSSLVEYHKLDGLPLPPPQYFSGKQQQPQTSQNKQSKRKPLVKPQQSSGANDLGPEVCERKEDRFRLEVKVLSCPSPSCIYVALVSQEEQIQSLMCELQDYYANCTSHNETWEVNSKCCAFSIQHKQWFRAIIVELLPDDQAKVFLKDFAEVEIVPLLNLQLLDPKFLQTRDGAIKCHLAGVRAAGDKTDWPGLACEYLAEQIAKYSTVWITKKGDIDKENWSLPVELWVKVIKQGGPLDPTQEEWLTLNNKLAEQGLAIPVRGEAEEQTVLSTQVLKELAEQSQEANRNSVSDWLQLSCQANGSIKTDSSAQDVSCPESISDIEDEIDRGELSQDAAISEWLPSIPITKEEFIATPTYVDDDCFIYLHDTERSSEMLTVIGNALLSRFRDSQPKPHDLYWFPGQLCIAQYHSDKKWYRGKVVEVNDDNTVKVLFVDYGNVEDCKATEMRKNVYMGDIPVQMYKCQLKGIKPASEDGKWPLSTLDFLHTTIVEKQCYVTLKQKPKTDEPLVISLIGPGNINITELLVRMQFAINTTPDVDAQSTCSSSADTLDESVIIEVEQEESSSVKEVENNEKNTVEISEHIQWNDLIDEEQGAGKVSPDIPMFKILDLPKSETLAVEVTAILSPTELIIHPCKVKDSELFEMKEEFEKLTSAMQKESQLQPPLRKTYIGLPCCACYTADDMWYRAAVMAVETKEPNQKVIKVQYVDYGNVEHQPLDKLRVLKPEWTHIPVQGLRCKLWGVTCADDWDQQVLYPKLMECLYNPPLIARIKTREPVLKVELLTTDESALVWEPLIEQGLLQKKEEKDKEGSVL